MANHILYFLVLLYISYVSCIKECDDYKFYVKPDPQHCEDNPDGERNMTDIVRNWPGVTTEEHTVTTVDGYQIFVLRAYSSPKKEPIVLGHGIFTTPIAFVNRGEKSLAYYLINQGHEVWIISFRGGPGSRKHMTLSVKDKQYWSFSFNEVGIYDLSAVLQLVKQTCKTQAIYIGHSLGTTAGYVYASLKPDEAKSNLKGMISLGPVAYMDGMKSYLRFFLPVIESLKPIILETFNGEYPLQMGNMSCSSLLDMYGQEVMKMPIYGDDFAQVDPMDLPIIYAQNIPSSVGVNVLVHLSQIMRSKKFQFMNFDNDTNMEKYGQSDPPEYNLEAITVPVAIFHGKNDWISVKKNSLRIYNELNTQMQCGFATVGFDKWNHIDFIEAKDIETIFYDDFYEVVTQICQGECTA